MRNWSKAVVLGTGLIGALTTAGCAGRYYDDDAYYGHRSYYGSSSRSYDHSNYDRYRDRDDSTRVRVCDADGDDCHWEYRRR